MTDARKYYDDLETRSAEQRTSDQIANLQAQIVHAKANSDYFGELFKDVDPASIDSMEALATLPVTRKSDLIGKQNDKRQ